MLFYLVHEPCLILEVVFLAMSVWFFSSLLNDEYSNLLIVPAFSNKSFSGKTSLPVKLLYLPIFSDDKAKILAVRLPKFYCALHR